MSDLLKNWVLTLDLSHLTPRQIEHLHALKNIAQTFILQEHIRRQKELNP